MRRWRRLLPGLVACCANLPEGTLKTSEPIDPQFILAQTPGATIIYERFEISTMIILLLISIFVAWLAYTTQWIQAKRLLRIISLSPVILTAFYVLYGLSYTKTSSFMVEPRLFIEYEETLFSKSTQTVPFEQLRFEHKEISHAEEADEQEIYAIWSAGRVRLWHEDSNLSFNIGEIQRTLEELCAPIKETLNPKPLE